MHFEDVKCPKQVLYYIEFLCKRTSEKKFKCKFHGWFPGLQNLAVLFGKFTCGASFESFPGRTNSLKPPVFSFCNSLPLLWKNQGSWQLWWDLFGGNSRHSKMQNISATCFLFFFALSRHYGFTNCFEILNFVFSNIPRGVSTYKVPTF